MPPVRRLAAILAADVVGYSRLMGADEEGTHERVTAHLRQVVNPKIAEHRGRIVKNTGDGMLAEFSSVVDAVRCAVEVQRGMVDREPELSDEQRTRFRIGVNLGDVIVEPEDIFGDGVNIAARLEALAEPGGICISRVVRDQIRDKLPYQFGDMGEQIVKHIARPIRVYSIGASAVAALSRVAAPTQSASVLGTIVARFAALIGFGTAGWRARPTEPLITNPCPAACDGHKPVEFPTAFDRRNALQQSIERSGARIFRRRDHRGPDHRSVADFGKLRDRAQYGICLQGQASRREADWARARRALCS